MGALGDPRFLSISVDIWKRDESAKKNEPVLGTISDFSQHSGRSRWKIL
ncbi:MAG: hypothetical protein RL333_752 [Pseudomonadota bacterium]